MNFLVAVNERFIGISDDFEMGYPEKLTNIRTSWSVNIVRREGRLSKPRSLYRDEELLGLSQAVEGGSPIYIYRIVSPKHAPSWARMCSDVKSVLRGMPQWETIVPQFLDEVRVKTLEAVVSVYIYNPASLTMGLYALACNDARKLQHLEILIEEPAAERVRILFSALAWDGKLIRESPETIINDVFGGVEYWMASITFHTAFEKETMLLKAHHLTAPTVEVTFRKNNKPRPLSIRSAPRGLSRGGLKGAFRDMDEFKRKNSVYLATLKTFLESHCIGLSGSDLFKGNVDE